MLPSHTKQSIVFLARNEASVRMDIAALRSLNPFALRLETQSEKTLAGLFARAQKMVAQQKHISDILICDEQLASSSVFGILKSMASCTVLRHWPVLILVSDAAKEEQFTTLGIPVLARPYSAIQLENAICKATDPSRIPLQEALIPEEFEPVRTEKQEKNTSTTSHFLEHGMTALRKGDLQTASTQFEAAVQHQPQHTKAHLALAKIRRMQRDYAGMQKHLVRAMTAAWRQGDRVLADSITALMPEQLREGNVFVHEAMQYLTENNFIEAARSFADALTLSDGQPLYTILARACQFTPQPVENLEQLCNAFERIGHTSTARNLRNQLLHAPFAEKTTDQPGWLDNYPRLRDTLYIVSHTADMWRNS